MYTIVIVVIVVIVVDFIIEWIISNKQCRYCSLCYSTNKEKTIGSNKK